MDLFSDGYRISGEVVLLLGSGISIFTPSNLPTGTKVSNGFYELLFCDNNGLPILEEDKVFRRIYNNIPFEIINDRCPNPSALIDKFIQLFGDANPNPVHYLIARLFKQNRIKAVITTNYDCAIEKAISDLYCVDVGLKMGDVRRVIQEEDLELQTEDAEKIYFKIHGSTDDANKTSLVYRLTQEGNLPAWKRNLLFSLIHNRILIVVGYSGKDFDICPEIPDTYPAAVVWNFYKSADVTPNASWVMEKIRQRLGDKQVVEIIGSMDDLFNNLFEQSLQLIIDEPLLNVNNILKNSFSYHEIVVWMIRLLASVNYSKALLDKSNLLLRDNDDNPLARYEYLNALADGYGIGGKYKHSAKVRENAASYLAQIRSDQVSDYYIQLLGASDMWRCYGNLYRSIKIQREIEIAIRRMSNPSERLVAAAIRNKLLLLREVYRVAGIFYLLPLCTLIRGKATTLIKQAASIARTNADWYTLQQLRLWNDRFGIPEESVTSEIGITSAHGGYRHLNFLMGEMMAFRDLVNNGSLPNDEGTLENAKDYLNVAKDLGILPEVWKLYFLILRHYKRKRNGEVLSSFWYAFNQCEYTLLQRLGMIIHGG